MYPASEYVDNWWRMSDIVGDWSFTCPTRRMARDHQRAQGGSADTYAYYLTMPNRADQTAPNTTCIGTCHAMGQ